MDVSLNSAVTTPTIRSAAGLDPPEIRAIRRMSPLVRKDLSIMITALYRRSLWRFAVCILLTTFNAAGLVFLVDCILENQLSPFILFSLVPMTWTLTKIWHEAKKDLVLVTIALPP